MKLATLLALLLVTAAAPLAAQGDQPVTFDALMNNEAEMAGAKIELTVILKNVHGLPKRAVREEAWEKPTVLVVTSDERSRRRLIPQLKAGTEVTLTGTCEGFLAGRFSVQVRGLEDLDLVLDRSLFPSRNWMDC